MFEASTPAAAITGPATDSTTRVTRPSAMVRSATTRTVPAATASSRVRGQTSPSAFETTLLDTTRQSPLRDAQAQRRERRHEQRSEVVARARPRAYP